MQISGRKLALAGGAVAAALAIAAVLVLLDRGPELVFADRASPPGFRDLVILDDAAGVTPMPPFDPAARHAAPPDDLCAALFEDPEDPRLGSGAPTVVYFSDYRCPYCRVTGKMLIDRARADEITLIFKEWPVLGPASRTAAQAALAAERQGAFLEAHQRLIVSPFVPNAAYARDLARWYGLDPDRLIADFDGPEVAAQIERTEALAETLGFGGVPGLVVGRTVALRSMGEDRLDALIQAERDLGPPPC